MYRALGIVRDITAEGGMEERLRQAYKMEALARMAGGLVHHFNNLLTVISGYAHILFNQTEAEDRRQVDLRRISDASNQAAKITEQLLGFSGHQFIQPQLVNLNHLLADMVRTFHEQLRPVAGRPVGRCDARCGHRVVAEPP